MGEAGDGEGRLAWFGGVEVVGYVSLSHPLMDKSFLLLFCKKEALVLLA
jgi:hypothetical protein